MKIVERGWAGHFICAHRCNFRRNTLIEHNGKRIVVSTVGDMDRTTNAVDDISKEIGCNRYYETMVFHAKYEDPYWEADVEREISIESDWDIDVCERETDGKANAMHETVIREIKDNLKAGCYAE